MLTLTVPVVLLALHLCQDVQGFGSIRLYAKGYTSRSLPKHGGWTDWFNTDHPGGTGDYESPLSIAAMFGRGCHGMPCRRPLAMKAMSIRGFTPEEEGNFVSLHLRSGLECVDYHQVHVEPCADYMVRFFCPHMRTKCRKSRARKPSAIGKKGKRQKWMTNEILEKEVNSSAKASESRDTGKVVSPKFMYYAKDVSRTNET